MLLLLGLLLWLSRQTGEQGRLPVVGRLALIEQGDLAINLILQVLPGVHIYPVLPQVLPDASQQPIQLRGLAFGGETGAHQHAFKGIPLRLPLLFPIVCRLEFLKVFFLPGLIRCHGALPPILAVLLMCEKPLDDPCWSQELSSLVLS